MSNTQPSWRQVIFSTLSAAFGVQSEKNRLRDFGYGKPHHYIIAGLILVPLFILLLVLIAKWAIAIAIA